MFNNTQQLSRLVWIAFIAVVGVGIAFGSYYYWDRYVRLDDQSPLEMGISDLEQAVRDDPQDPDARLALAQYYFQSGIYDEAITQSEQILNAYPENDQALFLIGVSYVQMGEIEAALSPLEEFAAIRRQSPMAKTDMTLETSLYFLGESYNKLNRYDQAVPILEEALEINHTDADAMFQLGVAYTQVGQHALAIEQYENAVRFVPNFTEAYHGMSVSYNALGQSDHVAYAQGMEAYAMGEYDTALTHLNSATANLPDFAPAHLGLGLTNEQLGNLQEAESHLLTALELSPNNFLIEHSLGRVQMAIEHNNN